jgi:hypothetical protein
MTRWAPGITAIRYAELGPSPASINRESGVMYLNPNFRNRDGRKLSSDQWFYIIAHEDGHLKRQTKSEFEADDYAFDAYRKEGRSLKQSVYALTDVLSFNKEEDRQRVMAQLQRAQQADGKEVKNYAFTGQTEMKMSYPNRAYDPKFNHYFGGGNTFDDGHEYFLRGVGDFFKKVGDFAEDKLIPLAGQILGGGNVGGGGGDSSAIIAQMLAQQEAARQQQAAQTKQILIIGGIAAGVLAVIVILIFALKK